MAYTYTEIFGNELHSLDLLSEWESQVAEGIYCVAARVDFEGKAEGAEVLFFPSIQRGGIAWGADAQWTDALTLEEIIYRYLEGDMIN